MPLDERSKNAQGRRRLAWLAVPLLLSSCLPESLPNGSGRRAVVVYFTDAERYAKAVEPYEEPVLRWVPQEARKPEAVLKAFFEGPTDEERARGLRAETSGCTGFDRLHIEGGVAHVHLTGPCASGGATYTVAQPIRKNLLQFDTVDFVKIYHHGETQESEGRTDSIPLILEP